jgi:glutathionyl-hydroquinone reductase
MVCFKINGKAIREYPNISNYTKELFQTPGQLFFHTATWLGCLKVEGECGK